MQHVKLLLGPTLPTRQMLMTNRKSASGLFMQMHFRNDCPE